jgi:hypothetical protein
MTKTEKDLSKYLIKTYDEMADIWFVTIETRTGPITRIFPDERLANEQVETAKAILGIA